MSTIEYATDSSQGNLNLPSRILDLMYTKGEAFTIRGFAQRLGISREYLRLMLSGQREIPPQMLEKIASGLGVSVARLKQLDTKKQTEELNKFFNSKKRTKPMFRRALSIASELVQVALGAKELGYALNNLGRVQYLQALYEEAHESWLRALGCANKLKDQFEDDHLFLLVSSNLMLTYTIRKEYSNMESLLEVVETGYADNPDKLGKAQYTRMKWQEDRGNYELARQHAYRALEFFEQTRDSKQIGISLMNVAHFEYITKNYQLSANYLSKAIQSTSLSDRALIHAVKEYTKALLMLKDYQTIIRIVDEYSYLGKDYPEYWAKLQIAYTTASGDPSYAEAVKNNNDLDINTRYLSCKCLMEFYYLKGDAEKAMRYYEESRIFSSTRCEYLKEEALF
ncbi:helix-turn-helix domain-containing protein [Tumebacillus flagellatus]|uniref:HTH cro/C1-type domain-containing protein n=1 Tax=Tumebacillus flagellatus TaxID=1157490 RepID=A0A074LVC1_9BACL|nr:helix-turn-helix transcriptional regulator [Tumebacillus flagellatus]KEO84919.1 hypothetical protein EL26_02610 [Tumebacillus flagellatus]